jgi:hypothetical protein
MRAAFRDLLDRAERHVRQHTAGPEAEQLLRDLAVFRRAADFSAEREALHGFEKFLLFCRWYAREDDRLRAELEPFVGMALTARERLGGSSLLRDPT